MAKNVKISRQGAIYRVALAGISSALALLLVWLSVVARYGTLGFFAAAGLVLMVPLAKKYYVSAVFAYAVSAGLSLLVGDLASVMGYILYFGPMAIVLGIFVNKKIKWFVSLPIQIVYAVSMLAVLYYVFGSIIVNYEALLDVKFYVFALVGTPVLVAINFVLQLAYVKIVPTVAKALRDDENKQSNPADLNEGKDDSPFDELEETFVVPLKKPDEKEENNTDKDEEE